MEAAVKTACPYISQVVVHGEGRKYVSALFTLDPDAIGEWAGEHGKPSDTDVLAKDPEVREMLEGYVAQANAQLERWETIKKFEILSRELSVDEGEVTPSLKIRRKIVEQKYADVLDTLYSD